MTLMIGYPMAASIKNSIVKEIKFSRSNFRFYLVDNFILKAL